MIDGYLLNLGIFAAIYAIAALGLQLHLGRAGLFNLGAIAFFALGAYGSAILTTALHVNGFLAMAIAAVISTAIALLIGIPSLRTRGDFFAIVALGFAFIVYSLALNLDWLTGGSLGIAGIPPLAIAGVSFASIESFFVLSAAFAVAAFALMKFAIARSPFGLALAAVRDDENAALSLGRDSTRYKLAAFAIGSAFASIAGSLFAHYITYIDPSSFTLSATILLVAAVILGGSHSVAGAVVGTVLIVLLPEPARFLQMPEFAIGGIRQLIYSSLLLAVILLKPGGLFEGDD